MTYLTTAQSLALDEYVESLELEEVGYSDFYELVTELYGSDFVLSLKPDAYDRWVDE